MDHADHVRLLRAGVEGGGRAWADLGAGRGAFTLALADLLGREGEIHALDRDAGALRENARAMAERFPDVHVAYRVADFTRELESPAMDGIVMANSLHFQTDQPGVVKKVREHLKPGGRLVIVEYNIEHGNGAVPYPVPFAAWERLARGAGFEQTQLLERRPSRWLREIYSAVSW